MNAFAIAVLAVWMVVSPVVLWSPGLTSWNSWIVGVLGAYNGWRLAQEHKTWQAALTFIASACIFVAGFIPRLQSGPQLMGRSLIFGGLLFVAGISALGPRHDVRPAA